MQQVIINSSKLVRRIIIISFLIALMYFGRNILIPLAFAVFFASLLLPVTRFFEKKVHRVIAILFSLILVVIVLTGVLYFFGTQFYNLFENIRDFQTTLSNSIEKLILLINKTVLGKAINVDEIMAGGSENLLRSSDIITNTISSSTGFLASFVLTFVFTFLFLLYRHSFKKLILYHFPTDMKDKAADVLGHIHSVAYNYFVGIIIIIGILGSLNGLGLMFIGVDYPFLFGFFAAFLAIIPYIGTFIGGLIPFVYVLLNHDEIWMAIAVVVWYTVVQAVEGNFLTPKIVGDKVSLNPLIAIIALLTGGLIWGIAGMILFIPFMAILKVIFDNSERLKPYGLLLGNDFGNDELPLLKRGSKKKKTEPETSESE